MGRLLLVVDQQGLCPVKRMCPPASLSLLLLLAGCAQNLDGEYLNAAAAMSSTPPLLKIEGGHAAFHDLGGKRLSEFYSMRVDGSRIQLSKGAVRIEFEIQADRKTLDCVGSCVAYADSGRFWHLHQEGWSRVE